MSSLFIELSTVNTIRIVGMVAAFCFVLIFFFVPETFWDRTPHRSRKSTFATIGALFHTPSQHEKNLSTAGEIVGEAHPGDAAADMRKLAIGNARTQSTSVVPAITGGGTIAQRRQQKLGHHVGFADDSSIVKEDESIIPSGAVSPGVYGAFTPIHPSMTVPEIPTSSQTGTHLVVPGAAPTLNQSVIRPLAAHNDSWRVEPRGEGPTTPGLHNLNSPFYLTKESPDTDYVSNEHDLEVPRTAHTAADSLMAEPATSAITDKSSTFGVALPYTHHLRTQPPKTFRQTLRPWNGQLRHENWFKVAFRPFILFAYPSILWSTLVYSLSVGWLIVLSETVSVIYRSPAYTYNFNALGTGLVYLSPFIGGVLGTAVAGKVSDIIVQFLARKNGGVYEPEFRLVMALPVAITTCIGLMGFGWSAAEHDRWIIPTIFFGIISFGCSLGSTTAITFAVDSYRQYAGEALVTLNFSKSKPSSLMICGALNALTDDHFRHFSRPRLLSFLSWLAPGRRVKVCVYCNWLHSAGLSDDNNPHVYLWKEVAYVDSEKEHDGEVLKPGLS